MTNTNVEICKCGDCEVAIQRAMKICEQAFAEDECVLFQTAVGSAIGVMVFEGMRATLVAQNADLPNSIVNVVIDQSVLYNLGLVENTVLHHMASRKEEVRENVTKWFVQFSARLKADHEAKQADSPNIKGAPKI